MESDLRDDEEALDDIVTRLRIRKYEIRRLRRVLMLPSSPADKVADAGMGADAAAGGRANAPIARGSLCGSSGTGAGIGSDHKDATQLMLDGDSFAYDAIGSASSPTLSLPADTAVADRRGRADPIRRAASPGTPGSESAALLRQRMLAPLPESAAESDSSSQISPPGEAAISPRGQAWGLGHGGEGLPPIKNTFFDLGERRDEHAGPATCPLPTEGWWSCSHSDVSNSQQEPSPHPITFDEFGVTPLWSPQHESSHQAVAARKQWADATPDCYGPTPDTRQESSYSRSTGNNSGDRERGVGGGSIFDRMLREQMDAELGDHEAHQGTYNLEDADAKTEVCDSDKDAPVDAPPPSAPSAPLTHMETPDISSYGLQTRISAVPLTAALGTIPLQSYQAANYSHPHLQLQCLIPNAAPVMPADHRGHPLRLQLARELGVQHTAQASQASQASPTGRGRNRATTWQGEDRKKQKPAATTRSRRTKREGEEERPTARTPQKTRAGPASAASVGSPGSPGSTAPGSSAFASPGLIVPDGAGEVIGAVSPSPAALETKKPCRHRGSKEAKDPDPIPDDPHSGLPYGAWVDLASLIRS